MKYSLAAEIYYFSNTILKVIIEDMTQLNLTGISPNTFTRCHLLNNKFSN